MQFDNKKLLIFDLDGTLINSALDLAIAINHMLKTLNRDTFDEHIIHEWVGNGALILVKRALSGDRIIDTQLDNALVEKALEVFLEFYEQNLCRATLPYPNVISTLNTLKEKYTLSIVTNKPFAFVAPILETLGMDGFFSLVLGGDSLDKKKPHPMPLLHVCQSLDIKVQDTVMIGDSRNDILSANACDMHSIGLTYGYNYGEDIGLHSPTLIIDDFSKLLSSL